MDKLQTWGGVLSFKRTLLGGSYLTQLSESGNDSVSSVTTILSYDLMELEFSSSH